MCCGVRNEGQVVACHPNRQIYGKGTGIKAHDLCAYLCASCHDWLDGREGHLSRSEQDDLFHVGLYKTVLWLLQEGHLEVHFEARSFGGVV